MLVSVDDGFDRQEKNWSWFSACVLFAVYVATVLIGAW
jgi:hypothetical protein